MTSPPSPIQVPRSVSTPIEPLLRVRGLCKYFPIKKGFFKKQVGLVKASDTITFDLMPGETLGLVGESGCGKTTTGRTILRALTPTAGEVLFRGARGGKREKRNAPLAPQPDAAAGSSVGETNQDVDKPADSPAPRSPLPVPGYIDLARLGEADLKPLRTQMQMIFQDPFSSLNPRMTVGDIVGEPLIIHGMGRRRERDERVAEILKKVGLKPEHRTRYPHAFSGGQRQRIGIARALIMHPKLVVCDEAVSALDVSVQAQVINLLGDLQRDLGLTYIFIAHDLSVVKHICDRIAVMYAGRIVELAETEAIFEHPAHPYTRALLSAVPNPDPDRPMNPTLSGEVADPGNLPSGCAFSPRCELCCERCRHEIPELRKLPDGREIACHLAEGGPPAGE